MFFSFRFNHQQTFLSILNKTISGPVSNPRPSDSVPPLSRDVALLKLEQKFKQAMARIEELLGEKEHLVRLCPVLRQFTG